MLRSYGLGAQIATRPVFDTFSDANNSGDFYLCTVYLMSYCNIHKYTLSIEAISNANLENEMIVFRHFRKRYAVDKTLRLFF